MPRYFLKYLGGAAMVDDLIGLAPSNHGTSNPFAPPAGFPARRAASRRPARRSCATLNSGDESPGGGSYTQLVTRYDEVMIPYTSGYLAPTRT